MQRALPHAAHLHSHGRQGGQSGKHGGEEDTNAHGRRDERHTEGECTNAHRAMRDNGHDVVDLVI
jgi:hypothetical protein